MSYKVLSRKWRPEVFGGVVAQGHIVQTLQNAIRMDRVAQAYLLSGPRGTGKTTVARLLSKALNCESGPTPEPCGTCAVCTAISEGRSMDVLEIDGASNRRIEEIRRIREEVGYSASQGKRKVYIIDEVHMLTAEAFNALLKTLEEPPAHVVFIFATTDPQKVPETILSRCQRYNFRRIPTEEIVGELRRILEAEGLKAEEGALYLIARRADGALRDALGMLDQAFAFSEGAIEEALLRDLLGVIPREVFFELTQAILDRDSSSALSLIARVMEEGGDPGEFTAGLLEHLRYLLVARVAGADAADDLAEADRTLYGELAGRFQEDDLLRMLQIVSDLELNLGRVAEPRLWLELTVMKLVKMASSEGLESLLARLDQLERSLGGVQAAPPVPVASQPDAPRAAPPPDAAPEIPDAEEPPPYGDIVADVQPPAASPEPAVAPAGPSAASAEPAAPPQPPATREPAASPEASSGGQVSFEAIQSGWDELVRRVKALKISVGTFLSEGRPRSLDERGLTIAYATNQTFHASQVERNREIVEGVAAELFGLRARVVCEVESSGEAGSQSDGEPAPEGDERVQMALKIFDGEVLRG